MAHSDANKAGPETDPAQAFDMTELMAAVALLNNCEPPSSRVMVPSSVFPVSERIKREKAEASATEAAEAAQRAKEIGCQMSDDTFYLGRFKGEDGKERDWFAAAEDLKDSSGRRLSLNTKARLKNRKPMCYH